MQDETKRAEGETEAEVEPDASNAMPEDGDEAPQPDAEPDDRFREDEPDGEDSESALKDQLLRALAETENVRRRARKDVEDARTYAISNFAQDLLGVADNLGRALESIPADVRERDEAVKAIADGVEMTARELETVLARHGITKIDPLGETFDYNLHQALFESPETDQPDGTVTQVVQVGYRIGERLLRAAMVGVAKGGAAAAAENGTGAGSVEDAPADAREDGAADEAEEKDGGAA